MTICSKWVLEKRQRRLVRNVEGFHGTMTDVLKRIWTCNGCQRQVAVAASFTRPASYETFGKARVFHMSSFCYMTSKPRDKKCICSPSNCEGDESHTPQFAEIGYGGSESKEPWAIPIQLDDIGDPNVF